MNVHEGMTLGAYRVMDRIGRGGMATVYRAYHAALDRYVALKVMPEFFAEDPTYRERFQQEARSIARLKHRNILEVFDFGSAELLAAARDALARAEKLSGPGRRDALAQLAKQLDGDVPGAGDQAKVRTLEGAVLDLANAQPAAARGREATGSSGSLRPRP